MALDRPGDEAVEKQRATDAPPPPPPPDRPGEGDFPSRAESRAVAAAAFEKIRQERDTEARSDTSEPESAAEEQDTPQDERSGPSLAPERDEFEDREGNARDEPIGSDREPLDDGADAEGSDPDRVPAFEFWTNDGRLARAYLDELRAPSDLSNEVGPQTSDPADRPGTRIVEENDSKGSLLERLRGEFYNNAEDAFDVTKKSVNGTKGLFDRPTGSHVTARPDHPAIEVPHQGINPGEAATALLATGIVIGELFYRAAHGTMRRREKEDDDDRD